MKRKFRVPFFLTLLIGFTFLSCSKEIRPIDYGHSQCGNCSMTIMDKKFGAEAMNNNGKLIFFDSAECMIQYLRLTTDFDATKTMVTDYEVPEKMLDANSAVFLHGGIVASPMGGNLAAFSTKESAMRAQEELGGDLISWDEARKINF